jgi:hypothetical protein
MSLFLFILAVIAMLTTLGILFAGIFAMAKGGEFQAKWSNKLMRLRVLFQAISIALLVAVAWAFQHKM